jgi:hypothetical protein
VLEAVFPLVAADLHGAVFRFCVFLASEEWGMSTLRVCLLLRG